MLTIQEAFGQFLVSAPSLDGLIPNDSTGEPAIYPKRGQQDSNADPYAIWEFLEYRETPEVGGPPQIADCRAAISCYSKTYDVANQAVAAIQDLFRFMSPTTTGIPGGPQVLWSGVVDTRDGDVTETGMFEIVVEVGLQVDLEIQGS